MVVSLTIFQGYGAGCPRAILVMALIGIHDVVVAAIAVDDGGLRNKSIS